MQNLNKIIKIILGIATASVGFFLSPLNKINEISLFNYKPEPSFKFDGNKALNDLYKNYKNTTNINDLSLENKNLTEEVLNLKEKIKDLNNVINIKNLKIENLENLLNTFHHSMVHFFNENF